MNNNELLDDINIDELHNILIEILNITNNVSHSGNTGDFGNTSAFGNMSAFAFGNQNSNINHSFLYNSFTSSMMMDSMLNGFSLQGTMSNEPQQYNTILQQSLYEQNPIKRVISDEVRILLQPIKYKNCLHADQNKICSITFEEFNEEDDIIQLPCHHCFFEKPIMTWLTNESCECPICRYSMDNIQKKISSNDASSNDADNVIDILHLNFDSILHY